MARRPRRRDHARGARARLARQGPSLLDRVPVAAWIVAGVVGLLAVAWAVAESDLRAQHRMDDARRTLLVELDRERERREARNAHYGLNGRMAELDRIERHR